MSLQLRPINMLPQPPVYNDTVTRGPMMTPQKIIQTWDDKEWERFTEECAHGMNDKYVSVLRTGGAGDMGVDIAAFKTTDGFNGSWDNYQCKYYDHSLMPTDIILEIGKVIYYTFNKEYSPPEKYYFVGPYGIGTKLSKYLRGDQAGLKDLVKEKWSEKCENKITTTADVTLIGKLEEYLDKFDFSIFSDITILQLLDIHRKTPYYHVRFGGGLPLRPSANIPPKEIADFEVNYIKKLLEAYAEFLQQQKCTVEDLETNAALKKHLEKARVQFYSAESLHKFSRDYLPRGEFERLQNFIFEGIENIILSTHKDGFEKIKQVIQEAYKIQIDSHPLKERLEPLDRAGICHQLANDGRLKWTCHD